MTEDLYVFEINKSNIDSNVLLILRQRPAFILTASRDSPRGPPGSSWEVWGPQIRDELYSNSSNQKWKPYSLFILFYWGGGVVIFVSIVKK